MLNRGVTGIATAMTLRSGNEVRSRPTGEVPPVAVVRLGRDAGSNGAEVGGKAASLDDLLRWGLPVPPAGVVPTSSFRAWLDAGIAGPLRLVARRLTEEAPPLRDLLTLLVSHPEIAAAVDAVQGALESVIPNRLLSERFAARSSAVGEDGSAHSFAGIYESFVGLRWEEMGAGVLLCWASAFTRRADEYPAPTGISAT